MSKSLADSEKLYEEIKKFFYEKDEYDFVIEISDRPMSEWKLIYVLSPDEMEDLRIDFYRQARAFAGFITCEDKYEFYFSDKNLFKSELIRTGEVLSFNDKTFSEIDERKVLEELKQLMAHKID